MWLSNLAVRIFRWAGRWLLASFCSQNSLCSLHKYWINAEAISGAWVTQLLREQNITVLLGLPPINLGLFLHSWTHASSSTTLFIAATWKGVSCHFSCPWPESPKLTCWPLKQTCLFFFNSLIYQEKASRGGYGLSSLIRKWVNPAVTPLNQGRRQSGLPQAMLIKVSIKGAMIVRGAS